MKKSIFEEHPSPLKPNSHKSDRHCIGPENSSGPFEWSASNNLNEGCIAIEQKFVPNQLRV